MPPQQIRTSSTDLTNNNNNNSEHATATTPAAKATKKKRKKRNKSVPLEKSVPPKRSQSTPIEQQQTRKLNNNSNSNIHNTVHVSSDWNNDFVIDAAAAAAPTPAAQDDMDKYPSSAAAAAVGMEIGMDDLAWSDPRRDVVAAIPSGPPIPTANVPPAAAGGRTYDFVPPLYIEQPIMMMPPEPKQNTNTDKAGVAAPSRQDGVQMPDLLQQLFGLDFLPFSPNLVSHNHNHTKEIPTNDNQGLFITDDDDDELTMDMALMMLDADVDDDGDDLDVDPVLLAEIDDACDDMGGLEDEDPSSKRRRSASKGRRFKSALGKLRTRVKHAKERRQQRRRRDRLYSGDSNAAIGVSRSSSAVSMNDKQSNHNNNNNNNSNIATSTHAKKAATKLLSDATTLQKQQGKLEYHKNQLDTIQKDAKEAQLSVERLNDRIAQNLLQVLELEKALNRSIKTLREDRAALIKTKKEIRGMERKQEKTERILDEMVNKITAVTATHDAAAPPSDIITSPSTPVRRRSLTLDASLPFTPPPPPPTTTTTTPAATIPVPTIDPSGPVNADVGQATMAHQELGLEEEGGEGQKLQSLEPAEIDAEEQRERLPSVPDLKTQLQQHHSSFIRVDDLPIEMVQQQNANVSAWEPTDISECPSDGAWTHPPPPKVAARVAAVEAAAPFTPPAAAAVAAPPAAAAVPAEADAANEDPCPFITIDRDVSSLLEALFRRGYSMVTDESERFVPVLNTERLLQKTADVVDESWPIRPWHFVSGTDALVWQGRVTEGPGQEMPVIKARGIIPATPFQVMDLIMDSSRVKEYNKMSQGRLDLVMLQEGVGTTAVESIYGVPGEAKIIQSLNKPPVIRRNIEMLSLIYARPLDDGRSYVVVSRSVWDNDSGELRDCPKDTVRSEIHLGVNLFRPVAGPEDEEHCEMTNITHVYTSAVPQRLAIMKGPSHAAAFLQTLQNLFSK